MASARHTTKRKRNEKQAPLKIKSTPDPDTSSLKENIEAIKKVYRTVQQTCGGADLNISGLGISGSLTPNSLALVFQAMGGVQDGYLIDFGIGAGRVTMSALMCKAKKAIGFELPSNGHLEIICNASAKKLGISNQLWKSGDIEYITSKDCSGMSAVYSFWCGMPFDAQMNLMKLCQQVSTVKSVCVFRDKNWISPEEVLESLNNNNVQFEALPTIHVKTLGRESKQAWVFLKKSQVC
eukprot:NODE_6964_length_823_cov_33.875714_g6364_i0.p1 GENE.NODE_6964_length_823_cov_33.875714_g6364_i0~~NODE_6964_length_823_cov_33.875714_g6364_i0.p1  ORF type:complete len:258 (+),score=50.70 NODE_6964_length_823_cov_33.875714_g6364_i0:61-774(+)